MQERWVTIEEFPTYKINAIGQVVNYNSGKILRESVTSRGIVKIGLVGSDGQQFQRGVALLVAATFVEGRSDAFDTPIHLDGDSRNNRADNLAWRPRWFAWKYARQFEVITVHHSRGPIYDVVSGEVYETFFDAAVIHGILVRDIWSSIIAFNPTKPTFPTQQLFAFLK